MISIAYGRSVLTGESETKFSNPVAIIIKTNNLLVVWILLQIHFVPHLMNDGIQLISLLAHGRVLIL